MKFFALMIKSLSPIFLICALLSCGSGAGDGGNAGNTNSSVGAANISTGGSANPGGSSGSSVVPVSTPAPAATPNLGSNVNDANPGNNGGSGGGNTVPLDPKNNGGSNSFDFTFINTSSDASGNASITVNLTENPADTTSANANSFHAFTEKLGQRISATLKKGDNFLVSALSPPSSFAPFSNSNVNSLSFPVDPNQTTIPSGDYKLEVKMSPNTAFSTLFLAKRDTNLDTGALRVHFFTVGAATRSFSDDIQDAINVFSQIYSLVGITVVSDVTFLESSTGILPNPSSGSNFYLTNSRPFEINVYLGINVSTNASTVGGSNNTLDVLGLVHSIPGPFFPSTASAVAISLEQHYGVDSVFNFSEIELLGETMAHESGHYLGLFHPVEFSDPTHSAFVPGDRLSDTVECASITACNGTGLSQNLMFPTPVTGVLQQRTLSTQQKRLLNLATIVN